MLFGHVFNIIVFAFNSKSKPTQKLSIHWKCLIWPPPLSWAPFWFWILYQKLGELLETCMIYNWMISVWKQNLPQSHKMVLLGQAVKKWLILATGYHFFKSSHTSRPLIWNCYHHHKCHLLCLSIRTKMSSSERGNMTRLRFGLRDSCRSVQVCVVCVCMHTRACMRCSMTEHRAVSGQFSDVTFC